MMKSKGTSALACLGETSRCSVINLYTQLLMCYKGHEPCMNLAVYAHLMYSRCKDIDINKCIKCTL